jgi:stearoyl-CoA desaturase (delta-9 desaturase)
MHHTYSDTEKDPHSPHNYDNVFKMMWDTRKIYNNILDNNEKVEDRFSKDLPEWKFIDSLGENHYSRIGWALAYIAFYVVFATQWWMFLLLPIHFLMGPIHGAIVNWCGHKVGYANFDNNDKSKNSLVFDFLMLGELFQNNHHKFSKRWKFSARWFEIDPTWPVIKMFAVLRIIRFATPVNNKIRIQEN